MIERPLRLHAWLLQLMHVCMAGLCLILLSHPSTHLTAGHHRDTPTRADQALYQAKDSGRNRMEIEATD